MSEQEPMDQDGPAGRVEQSTSPRLLLVQNWFTELAARLCG